MSGLTGQRSEADLQTETTDVLRRLIRFNTVNPPGNERAAQEYLAGYLGEAGLECELLGRTPERPNLVARLPGADDGPTLCLLSHVDTVLATASEWQHDPWSGELAEGCVWGRGALDMKSQTAAEVVAAVTLARSGWRPQRGTLLVVCVVDEEAGGREGAQWITKTHPDQVRCDLLINEGGGGLFEYDGRRFYGVCCAEKGVFRFKLITDGVAGHASMPRLGDNALLKMAPLLQRMADRQPDFDVTDPPRALLSALGEPSQEDVRATLERVRAKDPLQAALLEPMLGVTLAPTRIRASEKINVIPSRAELEVDCRVPPGLGEAEARRRIQEVLGEDGYRLEFLEKVVGNSSPIETELMDHIRAWVAEHDPEATCVPTMLPGFTDSRTFRAAFPECVAYGFFPHRYMGLYEAAPLVHSANERIDVRDLGFATRFFADLAERVLG
ncbi:MAG TPA: M20/M25/M40 family metallo-hydrolase [Solirubrobacteraceae bacterium]|nr:M20/M25/M40 family metallo-hydrolase [Solirubrobacteraceae bacterium]